MQWKKRFKLNVSKYHMSALLYPFIFMIPMFYIFSSHFDMIIVTTINTLLLGIFLYKVWSQTKLNYNFSDNYQYFVKNAYLNSVYIILYYLLITFTIQSVYLNQLISGAIPFSQTTHQIIWLWEFFIFALKISAWTIPTIMLINTTVFAISSLVKLWIFTMVRFVFYISVQFKSFFNKYKIILLARLITIQTILLRRNFLHNISTIKYNIFITNWINNIKKSHNPPR